MVVVLGLGHWWKPPCKNVVSNQQLMPCCICFFIPLLNLLQEILSKEKKNVTIYQNSHFSHAAAVLADQDVVPDRETSIHLGSYRTLQGSPPNIQGIYSYIIYLSNWQKKLSCLSDIKTLDHREKRYSKYLAGLVGGPSPLKVWQPGSI